MKRHFLSLLLMAAAVLAPVCLPVNSYALITRSVMENAGIWSSSNSYAKSDVVLYAGVYYISLSSGNLNHTPSSSASYWGTLGTSSGGSTSPGGTATGAAQYRRSDGTFGGDDNVIDDGNGHVSAKSFTSSDTVNNGQQSFTSGSGGDSSLDTPTSGVDNVGYSASLGGLAIARGTSSYSLICLTSGSGCRPLPWSCQPGLGDGLNAIPAGTYLTTTCRNETGKTVTLSSIKCVANAASSTCNATNGAGTGLLTSAVTGTSTYATGTQSSTVTIASGDYIKVTFVADGTTKQIGIDLAGTY